MTDERIAWTFRPTGDTRRRAARVRIGEQMAALSQAPLFADLSKRQLRKIADVSAVASFGEGKEIVKEGVAGSVFYVILEGKGRSRSEGERSSVSAQASSSASWRSSSARAAPRRS